MREINTKNDILKCAQKISETIASALESSDGDLSSLYDSMRYSACYGGKRVRPFITCCVADMLSADRDTALSFAVAVELVHFYKEIEIDLLSFGADIDSLTADHSVCACRFCKGRYCAHLSITVALGV